MGEHSKPGGSYLGAVLGWAKRHPKVVSAFVVGVVGVVSAVRPDFPAAAVLGFAHTVLGV
ncbi:hypothetical protein [Streptomyces sp. NPDC046832]|uniref:hypothetical protein n=1 Tax=Streptomyces sp. NPDC046832 TaxID=3155020 RepID=UPI003405E820